jgi:ubiquinol-cytochrome c reductase iron-sulfur subunit
MSRIVQWLLGLYLAFRAARGGAPPVPPRRERLVADQPPDPRAELVVAALLVASAAAAALFVVAYGVGWSTQVLGGSLAAALGLIGAALIVAAKRLIPTEELVEDYPPDGDPEAQRDIAQVVRESGDGITRKRLLGGAATLAGGALGAALIAPAVSLGPAFDTSRLNASPWRAGRRLVDEHDRLLSADDIEVGPFYTAFPEGADKKPIAAPIVIVKLPEDALRLPAGRDGWAPEGIVAYSKICTHAACAVALYRNPKFAPTQPRPALVCPCHYSTFDPASGGTVLFGPAGRPLPQLPLLIDAQRNLRAAGDYSGPAGPAWWGVRSP